MNLDQFEGISEEDRREILVEIDRVAGENKILVSDEVFSYTPEANGSLFPIAVNIVGVAVLAVGIFFLSLVFQSTATELRASGQNVVTAESRLIEEIRRETEQLLAQKQSEIADIQEQLATISSERQALAADIEARVLQREEQLRQQFETELQAERRRLTELNLNEAEIEARLADFAALKEREYAQRLDQFRRETETEQRQLEDELNTLEEQFNLTLQQANTERENLLEESQTRLTALQQEFQAEIAANEADLSQAEAEIARLNREQERFELVRGQIRGLYSAVNNAIAADDLGAARENLTALRTLLNEESTLQIPALREERPVDLFLLNSLESLIRYEERFGNPETLQRLSDATLIRDITNLANEASAAVQAGETAQARALYRQALEILPAVSESYAYLETISNAEGNAQLEEINDAAAEILAAGQTAEASEDWLAAIDEYTRVVQSYSQSRFRGNAAAGIRRVAATLAETTAQNLTALNERITELEAERAQLAGDITAAGQSLAEQNDEITRLEERLSVQNAELAEARSSVADATDSVASLQLDVSRLQARIDQRNSQIVELNQTIDARDAELEQVESELLATLEELASTRVELSQASALMEALRAEVASENGTGTPDPQTQEELARLRALESDLSEASALYTEYLTQSAGLDTGDGASVEVLNARVALERFLSDQAMRQFFPDLAAEVGRYDDAYLASGRENAFLDVADLLTEVSFAEDVSERIGLIDDARGRLSEMGGAAAEEFLNELALLIEE